MSFKISLKKYLKKKSETQTGNKVQIIFRFLSLRKYKPKNINF